MPDPTTHRRTHSLLLLQKLLSFRPGASPFTLVLDSLEQSGRPLIAECIARAKASKTTTILLSFEHGPCPPGIDHTVPGRRKDASALHVAISGLVSPSPTLIIIDTIHPLLSLPTPLSTFLPSLVIHPSTSLLLSYHTDVPLPPSASLTTANPYAPSPATLLAHLATTIIAPLSLPHAAAAHRAERRSLVPPPHGLEEGKEGVMQSLGANGGHLTAAADLTPTDIPAPLRRGIVLHVEHRRKSGRGMSERAFLPVPGHLGPAGSAVPPPQKLTLLEDHPLFAAPRSVGVGMGAEDPAAAAAGTFSLSLTERQRKEREGVVLPYYDAQSEDGVGGSGEGGKILYQMGAEDAADWDSEEDEL